MQLQEKIFCHWDLVRFITEEKLKKEDGTLQTLSVSCGNELELMIFLGKDDTDSCYEVRVYKSSPDDKYFPCEDDEVIRYEENDEYATFFFEEYDDANGFVEMLAYVHPEYKKRPAKKIEKS